MKGQSGQISIIPKTWMFRGFWGDSLTFHHHLRWPTRRKRSSIIWWSLTRFVKNPSNHRSQRFDEKPPRMLGCFFSFSVAFFSDRCRKSLTKVSSGGCRRGFNPEVGCLIKKGWHFLPSYSGDFCCYMLLNQPFLKNMRKSNWKSSFPNRGENSKNIENHLVLIYPGIFKFQFLDSKNSATKNAHCVGLGPA